MTAALRHMRAPSRLWPFKVRDDIVTVVDLGAQKIACAIVSLAAPRFGIDTGARSIRVLGSSVVRSSGFSGGRIANLIQRIVDIMLAFPIIVLAMVVVAVRTAPVRPAVEVVAEGELPRRAGGDFSRQEPHPNSSGRQQ